MTEHDRDILLARIDERTAGFAQQIADLRAAFNREINNIYTNMNNEYVRKEAFKPVQTIAFALVGTVALAVLSAVIKLVVSS